MDFETMKSFGLTLVQAHCAAEQLLRVMRLEEMGRALLFDATYTWDQLMKDSASPMHRQYTAEAIEAMRWRARASAAAAEPILRVLVQQAQVRLAEVRINKEIYEDWHQRSPAVFATWDKTLEHAIKQVADAEDSLRRLDPILADAIDVTTAAQVALSGKG